MHAERQPERPVRLSVGLSIPHNLLCRPFWNPLMCLASTSKSSHVGFRCWAAPANCRPSSSRAPSAAGARGSQGWPACIRLVPTAKLCKPPPTLTSPPHVRGCCRNFGRLCRALSGHAASSESGLTAHWTTQLFSCHPTGRHFDFLGLDDHRAYRRGTRLFSVRMASAMRVPAEDISL